MGNEAQDKLGERMRRMGSDGIMSFAANPSRSLANAHNTDMDRQRLKEVCQEFEAIFLHEILKGLRRTVPTGGSRQEALYRSLLDEEMARICSRRGLGLADVLSSQLIQHEELHRGQNGSVTQAKDLAEKSDRLDVTKITKRLDEGEK